MIGLCVKQQYIVREICSVIIIINIIIIMQRLSRHVSVIRMTNRRRGGHVVLRVAVSVIKRFEFLFDSACNDVQVASVIAKLDSNQ